MAKFYCFIFFLLFLHPVLIPAQNSLPTKQEINKLYDAIDNSTTDQQIGKVEKMINLSKKIDYIDGIGIGKIKLLFIYYNRSDYKKMQELIKDTEALNSNNNRVLSMLYLYKSYTNRAMGIEKEEFRNIVDGLKFAKKIEEKDQSIY